MAAIEKIDEFDGSYPGWKMYKYKHNHIQVSPINRKCFRRELAVLIIFKPENHVHLHKSGFTTNIEYNSEFYENHHGKWYEWRNNPLKPGFETLYPVRVVPEYCYCLYVPSLPGDVDSCYYNWSTKISSVKRRINRMMKYHVPVVKLDITKTEFSNRYNDAVSYNNALSQLFEDEWGVK